MGRKWSRKRKKKEAKSKVSKGNDRDGANKKHKPWPKVVAGNRKMEAFYALQGLHNHQWQNKVDEGGSGGTRSGKLVECTTDEQKEKERIKWLTSLRSMLPASFRIGTDVDPVLRERLELELDSHFVDTEMEIVVEEEAKEEGTDTVAACSSDKISAGTTKTMAPAKHIPYIPHAYQLSVDRRMIRRNPKLQEFHEWLTTQTLCGNITRQETVSMIPPIVLSVEPHHFVLDMCAAPGSKTSQLLEVVSTCTSSEDLEPRGCVVANDSDPKRAYMLVHQLRRINSPAVLVTSCDAQFFPLLKEPGTNTEGMFDRVLCDVPCSGDGTTRKNPGIWRRWSALGSLSLHPLQLSIALNGARLTKVGGYLCYSTCAMNPIENEAVVAELLRAADGSLELVDKRPDMPGLAARPGWSFWRVLREDKSRKQIKDRQKKNNVKMQARRKEWQAKHGGGDVDVEAIPDNGEGDELDAKVANGAEETQVNSDAAVATAKDPGSERNPNDCSGGPPPSWDEETLLARATNEGLTEFKSYDEVPEEWKRSVRKTCFPPTPEEAVEFHLEKCLRCLPHDMDTGGFFVALLKKVAPMSEKAKKEAMELAQELRPDVDDGSGNADASPPVAKRAKTEDSTCIGDTVKINGTDEGSDANGLETKADNADKTKATMPQQTVNNGATQKAAKGKPLLRGGGKTRGEVDNDGFVPVDDDRWKALDDFYGFSDTFPKERYMARANSDAKTLYFVGEPIMSLMKRGIQERVTIINSGLKSFGRNTKDCEVQYRVAQEGIHYLAPHMTKRRIIAEVDDFAKCIETGALRLEMFSDEFASSVRELEPGSFVVALKGYENDPFKKLFLVMWRCRKDAIDCLVAKVEMDGMKSKLRAIPGYMGA